MGVSTGVPLLGLDALASAAYGPEAALTVLLPAGIAGVAVAPVITGAVAVLMLVVCCSYWQTIAAYPAGGGSYTVAKENLGQNAALLAASALALDYVLNVAVAISAGVGAIASMAPALRVHRLPLCLGILALLTLVNLRGVRTSGRAFALPTLLFVMCLLVTLGLGAAKAIASAGAPAPAAPLPVPAAGGALGAWLVLRAFASGCTAMTGIEAVSDAIPVFREPKVALARRTLAVIVAVLVALLIGISLVGRAYHVGATPPGGAHYESVLSEITSAIVGRGWFYYVTMAAVVSVLCLSANTSFADFPRLCRFLARDRFLPVRFAHRGRRLVYAAGITLLAVLAGILLASFGGVTDRLIPLFAVGAFLAFTISQLGMVFHWRRVRASGARRSLAFNTVGAALTALTAVIVVVSKFVEGAWITVLAIPATMASFRAIRRGAERIEREIGDAVPLVLTNDAPPVVLVPLHRLDRPTRRALTFALTISPEIQAVQLLTEFEDESEDLAARWPSCVQAPAVAAGRAPPRLVVMRARYRDLERPFVEHVRRVAAVHPDRSVAVLLPELVSRRWWHRLLRAGRARRLRRALIDSGAKRIVVVDAPWYLDR